MTSSLTLTGLAGVPLIRAGDDLGTVVAEAFAANGITPADRDVLVVAQKIVSKAEGRIVDLAEVSAGTQAIELAAQIDKDARLVEAILAESRRVVRHRPNLLIVEHKLGFVMANAGVDHSNVSAEGGDDRILLLPVDPDASARALHDDLRRRYDRHVAVVISDSFGRPWRRGTVGVAIGAAGLPSLVDLRGQPDLFGRTLLVTETGFADEIAAAAGLVMGQADEAMPLVLVRGLTWSAPEAAAAALVRPVEHDLFR
jgi:coenzyme F420-0:L-glutamate ligase/coenzyme F420-1:gamma-L-glutamate ligase